MHLYHVNCYSHSMQNQLFCGRWCVVWIMNCFIFDCAPPRASNNFTLVWAETVAEWMNECVISCASLMMHFFFAGINICQSAHQLFLFIYITFELLLTPQCIESLLNLCARAHSTFYILVDFVYFFCFFSFICASISICH